MIRKRSANRIAPTPVALLFALLVGFLLAVLVSCSEKSPVEIAPPDETTPPTEKLVLVIIDGLRYSEGLGDPSSAQVPRMRALAQGGALIEPFLNDGPTYTRRAVPAIWSGSWDEPLAYIDPECPGESNQAAAVPTVFEYFRKHLNRSDEDCVYLVGNVFCPWRASLDTDYGRDYWPRYDTRGASDAARWEFAEEILSSSQPDFFLFYLPDVDHAGHSGDWDAYLAAVGEADRIVGELWDTLQRDSYYAGRTTMLVTNDHGRHDNLPGEPHGGFSGHGDGCSGCRTIQLLAIGPGIRVGLISTRMRTIPDITPTIGVILGFPTEQATGTPMSEILVPMARTN